MRRLSRRELWLTLIAFLVVASCSAILLVSWPYQGGTSKSDFDILSLSEYHKHLQVSVLQNKTSPFRFEGFKADRGADLLQWLVKTGQFEPNIARKLAGASGSEASPDQWSGETPIDTEHSCIFTCPANPTDFLRLVTLTKPTKANREVFMCYNRHRFDAYPDKGMVVLVAGSARAELIQYVDLPDIVKAKPSQTAIPKPGDPSFYGKYPFTFVASE